MFDFKKSLKKAAKEYGVDISPTKPDEVMGIIDSKDGYQDALLESIFQELTALGNSKKKHKATITVSLGFELSDGPKWELDWLIRNIELATLSELRRKKILKYKTEARPIADSDSYNQVVAAITCVPQKFFDWYGTEELGLKGMGNILAFHRKLVLALNSVTAALYYLQIFEWYSDEKKDTEGYIAKSKSDIQRATTLTRSEQDSSRTLLEKGEWLDVRPGKHGFKAERFRPLKPITISRKAADAAKQSFRAKTAGMSRIDELYVEFVGIEAAIEENPTRVLQKYENKITGELPPMDGSKKSTFSKIGDDIWDRKGFERYDHDENAMLADYARYKFLVKQRNEKKKEINEVRASLQK